MGGVSARALCIAAGLLSPALATPALAASQMILAGTVIIDDPDTLSNLSVTGGTGSGGGAGLGGALFVGAGANVTVDGVDFLGNTATGGLGGVGDTGGSLNGLSSATSNGSTGTNGSNAPDLAATFDGNGNGGDGQKGATGGNATNGVGGTGGDGGNGSDGSDRTAAMIKAELELAKQIYDTTGDGTAAGQYTAIAAAFTALAAAATPNPITAGLAAQFTALAAEYTTMAADATADGLEDGAAVVWETAWLTALDTGGYINGVSGKGGAGGDGGTGGNGSFSYGGGAGGDGGDGGNAVDNTSNDGKGVGGEGGNGGDGGIGGFGAGGGKGGDGGAGGHDAVDAVNGEHDGDGGAGGAGGFGAGNGSEGDGTTNGTGGGGGSGYGGAIFVQKGGTLTLKGDITFSGNQVFAGDSANEGESGQAAGTDLFMMTGSTVKLDPGTGKTITFNGTIADDSSASIDGTAIADGKGAGIEIKSGLVVFNGANTYSGQTKISGGVLDADDGVGIYDKSNINLAGGVLQTNGTFDRFVGTASDRIQWTGSGGFAAIDGDLTVRLNAGQTLTWGSGSFVPVGSSLLFGSDSADSDVYFLNAINLGGNTGTIVNNGGANGDNIVEMKGIISNGSLVLGDGTTEGTIVLSAANTYAGSTTVKAGTTLKLGANGSLANSSNVAIDGNIDISGTTNGASFVTLSGSGDVALGTKTLTVTNGSTTFAGEIAGSGGLKVSGGTQTLSGNNSYTGSTTIDAGAKLALSGLGDISESSSVIANGTFDIASTTNGADIKALTGSGAVTLGSKTLSLTAASGTFSGIISGSGGLDIDSGSQTLSGANSYTGKTAIASGATLALSGAGTVASSSEIAADGTFDISATSSGASVKTLSGAGDVALGSKTLTVANGSTTFGGVIAGSGGVTVSGGYQLLSGVNTYTGDTTIADDAKLGLTGAGAIAHSAKVTVNGELDIASATGPVSLVTLAGDGTVTLGATLLTLTDADTTFSGGIAGTGGLTVGGGTITLTGTNTYTGKTSVGAGATLAVSGAGSIAASSELALAGDLDISGATSSVAVKTLSGAGDVALGSKTLNITNASTTFTGSLAGTGAFVVSGGTLGLTGVTSTLGVTASGGTINISGGSIDAGTSDAALDIRNGGTITTAGVALSGGDSILHAGFDQGGKVANITLGAGTVIAEDNATLLLVDRSGAGSDGIVNLVIDSGRTANGDILDTGTKTGGGATNVTVKAGSSWTGLAEVTGFDIETGASVVFKDGSTIDGSLSAAAGSTLFGGTVFAPLTVTGTVEIDNGAITGNIYIEGDLALNGLISPGASPGAVSVGGNVNALSDANSKLEVVFGTATPVAGVTHDQINIGGDVTGALPVELARYGSTRGTALGNLADIELMRIGGDITGSITQVNRFTQNGHEVFLKQTTRDSSDTDLVIHTPETEQQFFGDTVTVIGLDTVVQDETYALATLPSTLNGAVDTVLGTYADRQGAANRAGDSAGWVRGGYATNTINSDIDRTNSVAYSQAGVRLGGMDGFSASLLGGFGAVESDVTTALGIAKTNGTVMSGGAELSWTGGGAYIDAAGQYGFGSFTVTPTDASNLSIDSQTLTGAVEAGVVLGDDGANVTPWVQVAYSQSTFSNMQSAWVDDVSFTDGKSTVVRAGVRLAADLDGFLPYAGLAVAYDLNNEQSAVVDNFEFGTEGGGSRAELAAGFTTSVGGNISLSGDFKGSYGLDTTDAVIGYQGTAGVRAYW